MRVIGWLAWMDAILGVLFALFEPACISQTASRSMGMGLATHLEDVGRAQGAFYALHGRFTTDLDSLVRLMPHQFTHFAEFRIEQADANTWRAVVRSKKYDLACAASGTAGVAPPGFMDLVRGCVPPLPRRRAQFRSRYD